MTDVVVGKQGRYFWLQSPLNARDTSRPISTLIRSCPKALLNKYVVVSSLDSGPLRLTTQQINAGWQTRERLALSPKIFTPTDVPFEWFDEWFIFDEPTVPVALEVFVNYGTFSLADPNPTIDTMYVGSNPKVKAHLAAAVAPARGRFWSQLEQVKPTSYVANGNCFIFVTSDADVFECVAAAFKSE